MAWTLAQCLASFHAFAQPVPPLIVPERENASDLIVTGRIVARAENVNLKPDKILYDIEVYSVLKGNLPNLTSSIVFKFSEGSSGLGVNIGNRGIFFLIPAGNGVYTNADPNYYSVVAAAGAKRDKQDDATPLVKIARELANVLATPPESIIAERPDLQSKVGTTIEIPEDSGFF